VWAGLLSGARTVVSLALVAVMSVYAAEIRLLVTSTQPVEGCGCSNSCSCRRGDDQKCTCAGEGLRMTSSCGCGGGGSIVDVPSPLSAICAEPTGVRRFERSSPLRPGLPTVPEAQAPNAPEPPP
jgi:hypothetical protein